jgi:hypothetical protein
VASAVKQNTHHELDIIREDGLYALLHGLRRKVVRDVDHSPGVACVEHRADLIPWRLIIVLDAERLNLKANNARKVCHNVLVVKDGEAQMVVQEELDLCLALRLNRSAKLMQCKRE